ncbi:efflux transporter outer membrane subunit [Aquisalimonas sp. 2447]|uniref:efflux transporter outer membrane subunit n=1 Tax=Aquisalimonas sp. 2447 TaxID=2740807 RepID=UPI00143247D1|nr:efflux transporter outer membrane subunit [Aquisalimonas sp. 2447]QIT55993.1 efflux transporter outer membrane subunit [Aquisalimonas sp. 2447]
MRNWCGAALMVALLGGCTVGPDYEQPDLDLPAEWPEEVAERMGPDYDDVAFWWELYEDPILERLVREALENNLEVGVAAARVAQARAVLGFRRAEQYPTLDGLVEAEREDPGLTGGGIDSEFTVAGVLSYELDLWGRLSRAEEAARAQLLGTAYSRDAVRLAVISDVASTYFDYRAIKEQIDTTENTIGSLIEALELERSRRDSGASTELAVRQAEAELETSRAGLPGLRAEAEQRRRALAVLVGDTAAVLSGLDDLGDHGLPDLPDAATELPQTLPSEMLVRRPDVRAAESFLVAANADIGATRAEWLPSVNLAGIFGTAATTPGDLFTSGSTLWEVIGTATVPILDFGRRQAQVEEVEEAREIAELQYRSTIQEAFREVGDAWTLMNAADERMTVREREVAARIEVAQLAERRYLGGYVPYLEVLDARRSLFDARLTMTEAARDRLVATATLYRALGGGWDPDAVAAGWGEVDAD